jgi:hypothetical protein
MFGLLKTAARLPVDIAVIWFQTLSAILLVVTRILPFKGLLNLKHRTKQEQQQLHLQQRQDDATAQQHSDNNNDNVNNTNNDDQWKREKDQLMRELTKLKNQLESANHVAKSFEVNSLSCICIDGSH